MRTADGESHHASRRDVWPKLPSFQTTSGPAIFPPRQRDRQTGLSRRWQRIIARTPHWLRSKRAWLKTGPTVRPFCTITAPDWTRVKYPQSIGEEARRLRTCGQLFGNNPARPPSNMAEAESISGAQYLPRLVSGHLSHHFEDRDKPRTGCSNCRLLRRPCREDWQERKPHLLSPCAAAPHAGGGRGLPGPADNGQSCQPHRGRW
jgi:hypothetical protein